MEAVLLVQLDVLSVILILSELVPIVYLHSIIVLPNKVVFLVVLLIVLAVLNWVVLVAAVDIW